MSEPVPSRLATAHLRAQVAATARGHALRRRALSLARKGRLRVEDPAVRYELLGTPLLLPFSHDLPLYRARHPRYSANLGVVAHQVERRRPRATVVDIGGNVGDSAVIVRHHSDLPVLCIEGDEQFLPYLRTNAASLADVEVAATYVATADRSERRQVARANGTARLVEGSGTTGVETTSLAQILRDHPRFAEPALLKIDTDGQDVAIIHGAADLLASVRPVLFFELDPALTGGEEATWPVFGLLAEAGYRRALAFGNTGDLLDDVTVDDWGRRRLAPHIDGDEVRYLDICAAAPADDAVLDAVVAEWNGSATAQATASS